MSFKFTALALDHGPCDALQKLVLMSLCDRADHNGVCFPSRADLSARCNIGASTLSRKLRLLEVQGWIQRKQRFNSSTVFRINVQRLIRLETDAQAAKVVNIPQGFEPFEDETAICQPIENKGDALSGHTDALSGHTDALSEPTNLSNNQSNNLAGKKAPALKGAKPSPAKVGAPSQAVPAGLDVASLTPFQRSQVLTGQTLVLSGSVIASGSASMDKLQALLRSECLGK